MILFRREYNLWVCRGINFDNIAHNSNRCSADGGKYVIGKGSNYHDNDSKRNQAACNSFIFLLFLEAKHIAAVKEIAIG